MNDVQNKLLELKDRGWTMAAIADELEVSHMSVFRWQKEMRKADNSRSVLYLLDTLMKRKRIPKQRRRGSRSSSRNASTVNRKSD
jgi:orotate phosphoribosyltransferase-like protein